MPTPTTFTFLDGLLGGPTGPTGPTGPAGGGGSGSITTTQYQIPVGALTPDTADGSDQFTASLVAAGAASVTLGDASTTTAEYRAVGVDSGFSACDETDTAKGFLSWDGARAVLGSASGVALVLQAENGDTLRIPATDGTAGQAWVTDGSGVLGWATIGAPSATANTLLGVAFGGSTGPATAINLGTLVATCQDADSGNYRLRVTPDDAQAVTTLTTAGSVNKDFGIGGAVWTISTAYTVGQFVVNDSGKRYICVTAGTSAGSGGPTGTGSAISDGSAVWNYVESINGYYCVVVVTRLKLATAGTYRSVAAKIEFKIVAGVLSIEGTQSALPAGTTTGITLTLAVTGGGANGLRATVANASGETVNGRVLLGYSQEDLIT